MSYKDQLLFCHGPNRMTIFIVLVSLCLPILACDNYSGPTAAISNTEVKLLTPSGLIKVDGLNAQFDFLLQEQLGSQARVLASYADAAEWKSYTDGLQPGKSGSFLKYYATITTVPTLANREIKEKQFSKISQEMRIPSLPGVAAEILEKHPRYFTVKLIWEHPDHADEIYQINTNILVNGKVLELIVSSFNSYPHKYELDKLAFEWRDVYLKETKP